ncbi:flagellar basal body-associated FliL family protein [Sphingomonas immobilis]|uniref:Flagellar protein FliL n=1 Tax=Sphingomonas immobilis TaxID=3063997 RepID=A0ABT8ZV70_9SPHN|nr:flagellar basal body-associated FliL family protein [Sphingomonas sp. CA1-15]MDO7841481.1 flagellar basal body-associated FliL family protein [Sphingomonas sp. CA1-15]
MSDKKDDKEAAPAKKKGGMMKLIIIIVGGLVIVGGGVGAGVYAATSGMLGGGKHGAEAENGYKLVPKSEQKRISAAAGEGGEGHGSGGGGEAPPPGQGGDQYASNYYTMDKEFTSNLQDSVHFIQVGIAISTPYDDTVITNLKTNEIAVRSAILMTLSDTTEDQVFTNQGKQILQKRLVKSINDTLKQKEGFGGIGNVYFTNFVVQ